MSEDESSPVVAPPAAVSAVNRFVSAHGEHTRAVVQPVSRGQVRLTLVGADGALGDVMVVDRPTAEAVVVASAATSAEWDRELAASVDLSDAHRARMAGPR